MNTIRISSHEHHRAGVIQVEWCLVQAKDEYDWDYGTTQYFGSRGALMHEIQRRFTNAEITNWGHFDLHGNRTGGTR